MRLRPQALGGVPLGTRPIDNSQVVREVDPRTSRELLLVLVLVAALAAALVLYAWPNLELRGAARQREQMSQDRERLLEENRKLRLEKAMLEGLKRVEVIAVKDLGLRPPAPEDVVVVERPASAPEDARLASGDGVAPGVGAHR
jgi:cell division protein FtsL